MRNSISSSSWSKLVSRPVLVSAAIIIACMIYVDIPLAIYLKHNVSPELYQAGRMVSKLGDGTIWVSLALLIYLVPNYILPNLRNLFGMRAPNIIRYRYHLMTFYVLTALASSTLVVQLLKHIIGRPRPSKFFETGVHEFEPFSIFKTADSFPSGHSQVIWTTMMSLYFVYPRLRPLYVGVALVVSLSRCIVSKHYLGDIMASALISILICYYLKEWFENRHGSYSYDRSMEPAAA